MQTEIRLTFQHLIRFTPVSTQQGTCLRPILPIRLTYGSKSIDVNALIDTGADFSTFDKGIARSLEIPDDQLILDQINTIGGMTKTWYCPLTIIIMGKSFNCRCAFVDNPSWPPVIGRDTIFSRMQFAFRQSLRQFYFSFQP
jgi:hypothetical protein